MTKKETVNKKTYYAIVDPDSKMYYTFEMQEDRLRNESWYQVCSYPEITLAALYSDFLRAQIDLEQILACKENKIDLKIIEVNVEVGKYVKNK